MSTQLFFRDAASDYGFGTNNARLDGSTANGWVPLLLSTSRGATATSRTVLTVAGPTSGVEVNDASGASKEWISPPLAADITISGSITWNLRAAEQNMADNVAINGQIEVVDGATGTITLIDKTARTTEVAQTTEGANNFAETPAAGVACKRGDRLRVRVFGDDAGTMGSGGNFTFWWDGPTTAASGDSYLTLTENLTFEGTPAGTVIYLTDTLVGFSDDATDTGDLVLVGTNLDRAGAADWSNPTNINSSNDVYATCVTTTLGTDYLRARDPASGGDLIPAGKRIRGFTVKVEGKTLTASRTIKASIVGITGSGPSTGLPFRSATLTTTESVVTLGGAEDLWDRDNDILESALDSALFGVYIWSEDTNIETYSIDSVTIRVHYATGPNPSASREAWTSRGAGVQSDVVDTWSGWSMPKQLTDSAAGGANVEWYTKQLTAFTLGGAVALSVRALESNAAANAAIRCEVAVCGADGSNAVVWGVNSYPSELTTSEAAQAFWVSGDDVSVTAGQRLRVRFYIDDYSVLPMGVSQTVTLYYAGTSGGASGDTFLTFPVTLAEFVPSLPKALLQPREAVARASSW